MTTSEPSTLSLPPLLSSSTPPTPQQTSPLCTLPAELRTEIFTYALSPYEDNDPSTAYQKDTFWRRPGYSAPKRTSTALLQTCKAIYAETWFMPFALAEHIMYLTAHERAPKTTVKTREARLDIQRSLTEIRKLYGSVESGDLRIFAQLYMLEPGDLLQGILDRAFLMPRLVRLTIRYTDFWHWEQRQPLYIDSRWVNEVRIPDSVTRFVMDFESLERRKDEVDILAKQAIEGWFFTRKDGRVLTASMEVAVSRWTGSSMFASRRWVRDESRPGELDYYVATVTWKLASSTEGLDLETPRPKIRVPDDFVQTPPLFTEAVTVGEDEMQSAEATMEMSAGETLAAIRERQAERRANMGPRRLRTRRPAATQDRGNNAASPADLFTTNRPAQPQRPTSTLLDTFSGLAIVSRFPEDLFNS
ncbi:hypothetical protein BJX99DRAFT_226689 [Aspergillus californicus]